MLRPTLHYTTVTLPIPGHVQIKKKITKRDMIPQDSSDLGSIAHIMSESHVWLYKEPAGCWRMGQQRIKTVMLYPNRVF